MGYDIVINAIYMKGKIFMLYKEMEKSELINIKAGLEKEYGEYKEKSLKLDMSRGKPGADQLDLATPLLNILSSSDDVFSADGTDCRNYGELTGIKEAKALFGQILGVSEDEIIIGGNSSLALMHDAVARAFVNGLYGGKKPWGKYDKVKFLCPSPGYDRHFTICETFGIEMITVPMNSHGPDMDKVEALVNGDETIRGIWCVPLYSNPEGISYSDEVIRRFANLSPKADDFRIFWDNAYCVHHLSDNPDRILNILDECKKTGKEDMVFIFASTSKISFSGAGISVMAASKNNISHTTKLISAQSICFDKLNQLRHARYYKDAAGIAAHMEKHKAILAPKFKLVLEIMDENLSGLGIVEYNKPNGGYFISVNALPGCAKRIISLCKEAGVVLTPAGATFPYGADPEDRNIRLAPTYPPLDELETAMKLFCICIKLASLEKLT